MPDKIHILKIGEKVIDNRERRLQFISDLSQIKEPYVLVHGGGSVANNMLEKLGIEPIMINGRRITDSETLKIVTMVYAGLINKQLVADFKIFNMNAIGLSGADANLLPAIKRSVKDIDYGFAGDIIENEINTDFLLDILNKGYIPVIATISADANGQLLNINADTVASALAVAFAKNNETALYYCFEKKGVLSNSDDNNSVISNINKESYQNLINSNILHGGMIPKLENAFKTLEKGVNKVIIGNSDDIIHFFNKNNAGTTIQL